MSDDKLISTIKLKIYPSPQKKEHLRQSLGNTRFVWNKLVELEKDTYKETEKFILSWVELINKTVEMKKKYEFLKIGSSHTLQQIARKLATTMNEFVKRKDKDGYGFPRFKNKGFYDEILIYPKDFKIRDGKIYVPKTGWVKFRDKIMKNEMWQQIKDTVKQIYIKEQPGGFFCYLVYERNTEDIESDGIVGIDPGLKDTITLSNGEKRSIDKDKIKKLSKKSERLRSIRDKKRHINKKRKIKKSNSLLKVTKKILKNNKKIRDMKDDFYYNLANELYEEYDTVAIEDTNLKGLMQKKGGNKYLDKNIHKNLALTSLGRFSMILEWKAELYNKNLMKVPAPYTSKECSGCGNIKENLKLSNRIYKCDECGLKIDRDKNAAINIKNKALKKVS